MKLRVTVEGRAYDVEVEVLDAAATPSPSAGLSTLGAPPVPIPPPPPPAPKPPPRIEDVFIHLAGTVAKVHVKVGDGVKVGDALVDVEAANSIPHGKHFGGTVHTPVNGTVREVLVKQGEPISANQVLVRVG